MRLFYGSRCILRGLYAVRGGYAPGGLYDIGGGIRQRGIPSPGRGVKYSNEWLAWVYVSEGVFYGGYATRGVI